MENRFRDVDGDAYSERLDRALALAARAHRDQVRKGSDIPYLQHPAHVAIVLLKAGAPEDVAVAAVLHDVVEDTGVSLDAIRAEFGDAVAAIVDAVTETKSEGSGKTRPWRTRKEEQLAKLARGPREAALVKTADALHNCASTVRDVRTNGAAAWARFNAPRDEQIWWYRAIVSAVGARLGDHALVRELARMVDELARA
jgi:(p)ppGpp synthase/HD superfamily hydrolase